MKKVLFILACAISALAFAQGENDRQRINSSSLAKTEVAPAVSSHLSDMENANSCASDTGGGIKLPDDGKKKDFCLTSDTGGRGQTIDPPAKKVDFYLNGTLNTKVPIDCDVQNRNACFDTGGGVRIPSDGKKHDFVQTGGGTIPGGSGKKSEPNPDPAQRRLIHKVLLQSHC